MVTSAGMTDLVRIIGDSGPFRLELARWNDRLVMVKKLRGPDDDLRRRFRREAEAAARLRHPNIIPLLAFTDTMLIYEYSPGLDLTQLLAGPRLPTGRITRIMRQLLGALEYVHASSVIHHDVKPGNIIIRGDRTLLADFGFAKDLLLARITGEHQLLGTPAYMSPEQFNGVRHDPRSDLYGAAAVLYHMLEGQPPFSDDVMGFLLGQAAAEPVFTRRTPARFVPLLQRALQREPARRFQTAREFRLELTVTADAGGQLDA